MKLASVKLTTEKNNQANNNQKINSRKKQNTNFKGLTEALVILDNAMKSSRAIQFTVEDMFGTNFPRSGKGLTAGYKYTHKLNWLAFAQEATREFLTGPTMCLVPLAIISGCKKLLGRTSNTHLENIKNFTNVMSGVAQNGAINDVSKEFFEKAAKDVLQTTVGKEVGNGTLAQEHVEKFANALKEYHESALRITQKSETYVPKKELKKAAKAKLAAAQEIFENIVRQTKDSYDNTGFLTASYKYGPLGEDLTRTGSTNIKNYIQYASAYMEDFAKKFSKDGNISFDKSLLENFKNSWLGKRAIIATSMFVLAGFFMSFIPKIYTKVSGNVNPNASAIYNEAKKNQDSQGGTK